MDCRRPGSDGCPQQLPHRAESRNLTFVHVDDLTFRYFGRRQPALRHVSFDVPQGGSLLVLGPSGCGKSTLGLCLNGAIPHFVEGHLEGRVRIDGRDTRQGSMADMAQRVGVVFQDPEAQFCMLTLEEEVAFGLENLAIPRVDMDARIDEALGWVGLGDRRRDRIEHLSGGQKQRLALACVLAQRPETLVFDEPTAQLDPAAAAEVVSLLERLRRDGRHTLIVIEHRLDEIMALVDDVLVLNRSGEVVTQGEPRRVLRDWGEWLSSAGVWVPQVSELATTLSPGGITLEPFPLTVDEAVSALKPHARRLEAEPAAPSRRAAAPQPLLSTRNLWFRYPSSVQPALKGVSVEIRPGELAAIVGPNGAGKSTLARHLVRILPSPPGAVFLRQTDLTRLPAAQVARSVGYVFQYPEHQFVGRSVIDDVAYGPRRAGLPEVEVMRIAHDLLVEFGLADLAAAHPYTLSHGEQRRLSVAAMLAAGQAGLLLDEPTFGQDRRNAHALLDRLAALAAQGRAIVAITHDMRLVAERAERALVMVDGQTIFDGSPRALFIDTPLLRRAGLRPPPLTEVGQRLGLSMPLLSVAEAVDRLQPTLAAAT
ncbi:MAG TPA: ABC transporter ATP-binding protein [Chloroflexota bacterium]